MEIRSTFWLPDITDWWCQQAETHSKYANCSNVARNIFSIILHRVGLEASLSLGRAVRGWRQSQTTGDTLPENIVVWQFAPANDGVWAGADPELDSTNTENVFEMMKEADKGKCTGWPRFPTLWRCGRAAKTYVLPRRNLALKRRRWPLWDPYRTRNRSSKHCGHSFHMMVQLHSNCQKDLLCHHLCLQRTSLEDELKYWMATKSEESTVIHSKVMRIAHLTAFRTLKIGPTRMGT